MNALKSCRSYCLLFILFLLITGCSYVKIEKIVNDEFGKKKSSVDIPVIEGGLNKKNKPIAFITIVGNLVTKKQHIENKLKKEARKIGGDAVIFVTYSALNSRFPLATAVIVVYE